MGRSNSEAALHTEMERSWWRCSAVGLANVWHCSITEAHDTQLTCMTASRIDLGERSMKSSVLFIVVAVSHLALAAESADERDENLQARGAAQMPHLEALTKQVNGEVTYLDVGGRLAFVLRPQGKELSSPVPWLWYAPTIRGDIGAQPRPPHAWMFRRFLEKGIVIAGVDVGESMGNPEGRAGYVAFHKLLTEKHGFAQRAILMPQSRGGLMLYNWAAENPDHVACVAGIYTVCDMSNWPGLKRAGVAYEMTENELAAVLPKHNPIDRLEPLAKAGIPILHIHGYRDKPAPVERHAGELAKRYRKLGGNVELILVVGKGHEVVPEFFERQEVVDFVIRHSRPSGKKL